MQDFFQHTVFFTSVHRYVSEYNWNGGTQTASSPVENFKSAESTKYSDGTAVDGTAFPHSAKNMENRSLSRDLSATTPPNLTLLSE